MEHQENERIRFGSEMAESERRNNKVRLLFVGSPLLDISAPCDSAALETYGLRMDDCVLEEVGGAHEALFRSLLRDRRSRLSAGGSSQNSARVAKWTLAERAEIAFAGCVGADEYAATMESRLRSEGVEPLYVPLPGEVTGICACLLPVEERGARSMCARLGAAEHFSASHLTEVECIRQRALQADLIYVEGYFLSHSPDVMLHLARTCPAQQLFSLGGILVSTSFVLHYLRQPRDVLLLWLLRACYLVDVSGIAFHAVLFVLSTMFAFGAYSEIPPLLLPWLFWSPFLLTAVVVQMVMVTVQQPNVAPPVAIFCLAILLGLAYASTAVAAYHRRIHDSGRIRLRIFNLGEGELPRVVDVPRRLSTTRPQHLDTEQPEAPFRSEQEEEEMGRKLADAYVRFVAAARESPGQQELPAKY